MPRKTVTDAQISLVVRELESGIRVEDVCRKLGVASRPRYGYLRLHLLLRREGWQANKKRIYRIYLEEGLQIRMCPNLGGRSNLFTLNKFFSIN